MQSDHINALKRLLLEDKSRLEACLAQTTKHLYHRDEPYDRDSAEQAIETQNNEVVEHIDREAQLELAQINGALERIEQGNYGVCSHCGQDIREERLRAIPYTDVCIQCAEVD